MDRRQWLERAEAELAGRGLPAGVRARLLGELRDHLDDLTEGGDMGANVEWRMGDPAAVASAVGAGGWVRRHPLVVFGLAPVPALLVAAAAYTLVVAGLGYAVGLTDGAPAPGVARTAAFALLYGVAFVPFLAVAGGIGWLAVRSGTAGWWAAVGLAQVVLVAGLLTIQATWSDLPGQSTIAVGLGFPLVGVRQAAQMLLPLSLGWYAIRKMRRPVVAMA
jgi:hypothetical protein